INNLVGRRLESATITDNQELRRGKFSGGCCGTLVAMTTETGRKKRTPQILKTDTSHTALKLAEKWVANMTTSAEDPIEPEPDRLGLGAKVSRQMKRRPSDDPLDQKLQAKFDAGRRKYARSEAERAGTSKHTADDDSEDDDESESKSQVFGKKRQNTSTRR
ncbi:unnamed protein product, partial [Brassica rapa]